MSDSKQSKTGDPLGDDLKIYMKEVLKTAETARIRGEESLRESLRETLRETAENAETARIRGEESLRESLEKSEAARLRGEESLRDSVKKAQEKVEEARAETEKVRAEAEKAKREREEAQKETQKCLQELTKDLNKAKGDFTNKWGLFMENLVQGDLVKLLQKRNIEVNTVHHRRRYPKEDGKLGVEFDLVAINGHEVVVVEVKTTLTKEKVQSFLGHLKMFRDEHPEFENKTVYGGVAYLSESTVSDRDGQEEEGPLPSKFAEDNGLFVIRSPGGESNVAIMSNPKDFRPKAF